MLDIEVVWAWNRILRYDPGLKYNEILLGIIIDTCHTSILTKNKTL